MRSTAAFFIACLLLPVAALATSTTQPPRWVLADDLRVRLGPGTEHRVVGKLSRGAELILKTPTETDGFCLIEGEGQYGYVACSYLSATPVARPRAGVDGVDAAQRWVTGSALNLREAPRQDAPVLGQLALNTVVKLLRDDAGSGAGYCQVQPGSGPSGYTACRYLSTTPVVLAPVRGQRSADAAAAPGQNLERAFWIAPGWPALEQYATQLQQRRPDTSPQGPWPRDEALERMKAHLALGLKGASPLPYADWAALKRQAAAAPTSSSSHELQAAIGLWGPLHDAISADGGAERIANLVRALEFPAVRPSLFRAEAELAPPTTTAEEGSGRFGIVYRQLVSPRPLQTHPEARNAGLHDMLARTQLLVRPVQQVRLFRDGTLRSEPSHLRSTHTLWHEVDAPMCADWVPGFVAGHADASIWRAQFGADAGAQARLNRNPPGQLYSFYTVREMPLGPAATTRTPMRLDRAATGFIAGTHLHYDLDADGVPDLAVWEGQGKGPGHLDGMTTTDDRWYRLVLANVGGAWKVLGSDVFAYGCGC